MDDSAVKDLMLEALAAAVTQNPPEKQSRTKDEVPAQDASSNEPPPWEAEKRPKFSPLDFETTISPQSGEEIQASDFPQGDAESPEEPSEELSEQSSSEAGVSVDMRIEDGDSLDPDAGPQMLSANAGMMLSDEDDALAFPDHLYGGSEADSATSGERTAEQRELEELRELVAEMQDRIDQLTRDERRADMKRRRLSDEKETLSAQVHAYKDRLISKNDELSAYRRRAEREREEAVRRETKRVARNVLPVVDHMELALANAQSVPSIEGLLEGIDLIINQFHKTLAGLTIIPIEVERGTAFDPKLHEAMLREADPDVPAATITRSLRTGYMLGDLLLRAARVAVAEGTAEVEEPEEPEDTGEAEGVDEGTADEDDNPSLEESGDVTELDIEPLEESDSMEEASLGDDPEPSENEDSSEQGEG